MKREWCDEGMRVGMSRAGKGGDVGWIERERCRDDSHAETRETRFRETRTGSKDEAHGASGSAERRRIDESACYSTA